MMNEIEARELHSEMAADDDYNDACSSFESLLNEEHPENEEDEIEEADMSVLSEPITPRDMNASAQSITRYKPKHPKQRTTTLSSNHSEIIGGVEFVQVATRKKLLKAASKVRLQMKRAHFLRKHLNIQLLFSFVMETGYVQSTNEIVGHDHEEYIAKFHRNRIYFFVFVFPDSTSDGG